MSVQSVGFKALDGNPVMLIAVQLRYDKAVSKRHVVVAHSLKTAQLLDHSLDRRSCEANVCVTYMHERVKLKAPLLCIHHIDWSMNN